MAIFQRFEDSIPEEAAARRLTAIPVSAFDHWLTEDEYVNATPFTFYGEALRKGLMTDYIQIEARFLDLLGKLSEDGASLIRFPDLLRPINPRSSHWLNVMRRGLRYKAAGELYFHKYGARFLFGFDLTHWLVFSEGDNAHVVSELARKSGLYVLEP